MKIDLMYKCDDKFVENVVSEELVEYRKRDVIDKDNDRVKYDPVWEFELKDYTIDLNESQIKFVYINDELIFSEFD